MDVLYCTVYCNNCSALCTVCARSRKQLLMYSNLHMHNTILYTEPVLYCISYIRTRTRLLTIVYSLGL